MELAGLPVVMLWVQSLGHELQLGKIDEDWGSGAPSQKGPSSDHLFQEKHRTTKMYLNAWPGPVKIRLWDRDATAQFEAWCVSFRRFRYNPTIDRAQTCHFPSSSGEHPRIILDMFFLHLFATHSIADIPFLATHFLSINSPCLLLLKHMKGRCSHSNTVTGDTCQTSSLRAPNLFPSFLHPLNIS